MKTLLLVILSFLLLASSYIGYAQPASDLSAVPDGHALPDIQGGLVGPLGGGGGEDTPPLSPGAWAVTQETDGYLRVRNAPGLSGTTVGYLGDGVCIHILEGPISADGYWWYRHDCGGWSAYSANGFIMMVAIESHPSLNPGDWAITQETDGMMRVRNAPGTSGTVLSQIGDGVIIHIEEGPVYADGLWWYRHDHGGWSAYSANGFVMMVPYNAPPHPSLNPGDWAITQETDGMLRIRTSPGTSGSVVGQIGDGVVLHILEGPVFADGYWWYRHDCGGWSAYSANGFIMMVAIESHPSLNPGDWAITQETDGMMRVRNAPGTSGTVLSQIGDGVIIHIEEGPVYADGLWWYRHDHGGWSAYSANGFVMMVPYNLPPRPSLNPGDWAITQETDGMLRVRDTAGVSGATIGHLGDGVVLHIEEGPIFADGYWWYRHNHGGWSAYSSNGFIMMVYYVDTTPPVLTVLGTNPVSIEVRSAYVDQGATASDDRDGNVTSRITTENSVNPSQIGEYTVTYRVTDLSGNAASPAVRTVRVVDTTTPVIMLNGTSPVSVEQGSAYVDPGATATDNYDGVLTPQIVIHGSVDTSTPGTYTITYDVTDSSGNPANQVDRVVNVLAPPTHIDHLRELRSLPVGLRVCFDTAGGVKIATSPSLEWPGSVDHWFAVEEEDRTAAIFVRGNFTSVSKGASVTVVGVVSQDDCGNSYVDATNVTADPASMDIRPFTMVTPSIGSQGLANSSGPYNIGLLVCACGTVKTADQNAGTFTVSDGAVEMIPGIGGSTTVVVTVLVPEGVSVPGIGGTVMVKGISSCRQMDGNMVRILKVREQGDIVTVQ